MIAARSSRTTRIRSDFNLQKNRTPSTVMCNLRSIIRTVFAAGAIVVQAILDILLFYLDPLTSITPQVISSRFVIEGLFFCFLIFFLLYSLLSFTAGALRLLFLIVEQIDYRPTRCGSRLIYWRVSKRPELKFNEVGRVESHGVNIQPSLPALHPPAPSRFTASRTSARRCMQQRMTQTAGECIANACEN